MGKPKIRFKGYTDEWEQRKLGEVAQCLDSERIPINAEEREKIPGEIPYYGAGNIQGYINKFLFDEELVLLLEDGDAFDDFRTKEIAQYICGKTWVNNHAHVLRPLGSAYFLYSILAHKDIRNWVQLAGSSRKKLVQKSMLNIELIMPKLKEQQKIGNYFRNLDHLITLHQRKYEKTQKLKKYMLQKMFPQNGRKVPEIRFSGFTEEREQRKFGEIVEKYEDPVETPTEGYTRLGIRSHAKGTFHSYVEKGKELETAKMFRVAADKFIVNITFGWEHAVAITDENDAGKLVSHRFPQYSFNAGMVPKFFRYLILDENFKHHLELSSPGGAGRNRVLKLSDMLEYKMNFPSEAEQKKIAAYFDDLDNLITLHQQKCDELRNVKKFMLQNMFI